MSQTFAQIIHFLGNEYIAKQCHTYSSVDTNTMSEFKEDGYKETLNERCTMCVSLGHISLLNLPMNTKHVMQTRGAALTVPGSCFVTQGSLRTNLSSLRGSQI